MSTNSNSLDSDPGPPPPTLDTVLGKLGDPGRYQVVLMLLLATNYIPVVVNHLLMAFYTGKVQFNCRVPNEGNKSLYIPHSNNSSDWESCAMYADPSNHSLGTQDCAEGYEFHFYGENEWTITAEWGLVCDRAFLAPLMTTTYFCGVMLGGVIFGGLSDRFGRKWIMLFCLYSQCIIGIVLHFVQRLVVFIGLRFIQGILIQGLQCVTYSMIMELFCPSWRTLAGCVAEAFWAGGIIILAIIAKYVEHWRYIQLAINIPTIATLLYIWIIPESLRWLLSKGKVKKAETVVNSYIGYNSLKLDPASLRLEMEAVSRDLVCRQDARRPPDITDILRVSVLRNRAFILYFVWFSVSICYYGIAYYVPNLSGDRYLNFVMGGGIELGSYLLAFVVLGGFGRRGPLCIYLMLSGVICISAVLIKTFITEDMVNVPALVTGLALIGKATIVSCFCTIFIYSSEVFPTVIRTVGVGSCTFFGRVGSLLAPQVLLLGEWMFKDMPGLVPFLTFGVLCLIAALLTLYLPETLNTKLPDTIEEAIAQANQSHHKSSDSLDVGYGKCPEFVCVDGLIVSKDNGWHDTDSGQGGSGLMTDTEPSLISNQGTLTTLRSRTSITTDHEYETIAERKNQGNTSLYSINFEKNFEPTIDVPITPRQEPYLFKNFSYSNCDNCEDNDPSYTAIMKTNEQLLNSHMANIQRSHSRDRLSDTERSSSDNDSRINLVPDVHHHTSQSDLYSTSQDSSVVSADHSIIYQAQVKDESIKELLRQKLIVFDSDETRL